ncbi:LysE family translocator [Antarcticirhabdus aurantiaca]|uniref:LysE family translocator n=1 Tax=Antarcticirhabdus aurantiaca TaxID=2606717 RepID=A0ACD4NT03_9HYPH|nr:LysE family translocator [Antarcticirhabdus aurantiaca]WAJ29810.1 LysE family translocator [Jeongeuplla avenae]
MSPEFLLTSLIVVASPGTGVVLTLAAGLSRGARASLVCAFGCTLGIVPHMLAAITGLAALLHASALAFALVKYAGVAYLLWMAWATMKEHGPLRIEAEATERSDRDVIVSAILANLLNPKLSIFFVAFLPQFVPENTASPVRLMGELSLVFMALTFGVFALYGVFAAAVRERIVSRPAIMAWLRRGFAAAFVGLGAKLALTER